MVERSTCLGPALIHILSSTCCASSVCFCSRPARLSPSECLSHLTACVFHLNTKWQSDSTPDSHPSVLLAAAGCSWGSTPGSSPKVRLLTGLLKAWTPSKELTGPAHPTDCQGKQSWGGAGETVERQGGIVSPPYRWDSSESAAQTSVQMDQGHSPTTLRGLGVRLARRGQKAKSGGNGNDGRRAQVQTVFWRSIAVKIGENSCKSCPNPQNCTSNEIQDPKVFKNTNMLALI